MNEKYDYVVFPVSMLEKLNKKIDSMMKRVECECDLNEIKNDIYNTFEDVLNVYEDDGWFLNDAISDVMYNIFNDSEIEELIYKKTIECLNENFK